jgi:hypothetical protein
LMTLASFSSLRRRSLEWAAAHEGKAEPITVSEPRKY